MVQGLQGLGRTKRQVVSVRKAEAVNAVIPRPVAERLAHQRTHCRVAGVERAVRPKVDFCVQPPKRDRGRLLVGPLPNRRRVDLPAEYCLEKV